MLNNAVSIGSATAGRLASEVLAMSLDHPLVPCVTLSALAGVSCAMLLDMFGRRISASPGPALVKTIQAIRVRQA